MIYKIKAYPILEFGKRKDSQGNPHQEDSIYPPFGRVSASDRLFIVCDGMGGHDLGEVASATVCDAISTSVLISESNRNDEFTTADLKKAITKAYDALDAKDSGSDKKMGTTLALLKLHREGATVAHLGDSRIYHIRPGKTEKQTKILYESEDHSLLNCLIKAGEMTREEARRSNQKNIITKAMQPHSERFEPDVKIIKDIRPGDYFYLCSDGMLEKDEMEEGSGLKRIFSNSVAFAEEKIRILKEATSDNSDNHSAYVVHILDVKKSSIDSYNIEDKDEGDKEPDTSIFNRLVSIFK